MELTFEGRSPLINHGFEFIVVDVRERQVENVAGTGSKSGKEAVEEDGMEDSCVGSQYLRSAR